MSARLGSKTVNKCYQSMRMASRVLKPKMMPMNKMCRQQFKDTPSYNEYCRLSKQMAKCANTYHIRPSEMQRVQAALVTCLIMNLSPVAVNLTEVLSGILSSEDEEGSSSGVRRRRKLR